jgi:hypothetical protein
MGKTTKTLLVLALAGLVSGMVFVTGLINVENMVALYAALPAGAILFGLFLISRMLEKETARYDQEQGDSLAAANAANSNLANDSCSPNKRGRSALIEARQS